MGQLVLRTGSVAALALFPLLLWQGNQVRRRTPRLPGALLETDGTTAAAGEALRIVVIGESTAAGVGVASHRQGLAGQVAHSLSAKLGRRVDWQAVGKIGATARDVKRELVGELRAPTDVVIVALGVNDTLRFTSLSRWRRDLSDLIGSARKNVGPAIVMLSPVPPLGSFSTLPQPLRAVLGLHARALDRAARAVADQIEKVVHVPVPFTGDEKMMCDDRFHPSAHGYQIWGECIARAVYDRLKDVK